MYVLARGEFILYVYQPAKVSPTSKSGGGHHIFGYKKGVLENFDDNFMPQKCQDNQVVKTVSYSRNRLK